MAITLGIWKVAQLRTLNNTAETDGWVEYSYIINFKDNTFGVYGHIDCDPIKVYSLSELPEEDAFIQEIEAIESESDN